MNIYARFFDNETLVRNADELLDFLRELQDFSVTAEMEEDIRQYVSSDIRFPRRYKIRPRIYFILIKTNASSMEEFKANNKANNQPETFETSELTADLKEQKMQQLLMERQGWYRCKLQFKRVLQIPGTTKFQYQDTNFEACIKAISGQECYNRIINYLQNRSDIDMRSQFPSAKGSSYIFEFLGEEQPDFEAIMAENDIDETDDTVEE